MSKAQEVLEENDLEVFSVKQIRNYADRTITIKFRVKYENSMSKSTLFKQLKAIDGVTEVDFAKRVSD